jgi:hypothetical protein
MWTAPGLQESAGGGSDLPRALDCRRSPTTDAICHGPLGDIDSGAQSGDSRGNSTARMGSHDRAYFADSLKALQGVISPPRFNPKNELMVRKHVHAAALTAPFRLTRPDGE